MFGQTDLVRLLIENTAALDVQNNDEATALFVAALFGHPDAVKLLLARDAARECRRSRVAAFWTVVVEYEVEDLNAYFERAKVVKVRLSPGAVPPQALLFSPRAMTAFVDPWRPEAALQQMIELSRRLEQFVSVLPLSFALQLQQYSTGSSSFSRQVKTSFPGKTRKNSSGCADRAA
ncbi:MAG: ankyrin repeat domain-containing protein [Planctomycetes bacterium]|nr:ankyrin repeat domain-containing protein [Planctomycetota bacterium]